LRLSAEKDSEVTFDEVVTARKERSQQYKRKQPLGVAWGGGWGGGQSEKWIQTNLVNSMVNSMDQTNLVNSMVNNG
jgi:hypothetical protein